MGVAAFLFLVSLGIGILCAIGYRRAQHKLSLVQLVPTSTIAELADRLPGELVELKGLVRSSAPLTSEIAGLPCVYYRSVTTREYEETRRTSKGGISRQRGSEVVSQNEQRAPFELEDATGRVMVDPFEADIDARKLVDRFEPTAEGAGAVTIGGITLGAGTSRTLGYRKVEHAVLVDHPAYVLGVLQDDGSIGPPPEGSRLRRYLISSRSEEELANDLRQRSHVLLAGAAVSFLVAAGGLVFLLAHALASTIGTAGGPP